MFRLPFALLFFLLVLVVSMEAQVYTIQPRPVQVDNRPRGSFSLSLKMGGAISATFEDVGGVSSVQDIGDLTSLRQRSYDDGLIGVDGRGTVGGDDGRTNRWGYRFDSQITPDGNVAMHQYSTTTNGTDLEVDAGSTSGVDMQYDFALGVFGSKVSDRAWTFSWGGMLGGVITGVNTKTRRSVTANLVTTTDLYSLEGAIVPAAPYLAPSTATVDGVLIDNTVLLNNRPFSRSTTTVADGAQVDGFWQVKGGLYTVRAGPWLRWHFGRSFSLRASAGATYTFLGVKLEFDELLEFDQDRMINFVRTGALTTPEKQDRFGFFGALDAEWWVSDRTAFFGSVTYEDSGDDVRLTAGDRTAVLKLPSGAGFRAGLTVLF